MDIVNRFILQASSIGIDKVARDADKLTRAAGNSAKGLEQQFKKVGQAAAAAASQVRNSFGNMFRGRGGAGMSGGGPGGGGGYGGGGGAYGPGGSAGGFGQGFLQGLLPQQFIQRGPGALAQGVGSLAGRGLRGAAGAVGSAAMGDLQGTIAALGNAVPIVGGPLAALAGRGVGESQRALQYFRDISSAGSSIGGIGSSFGANRGRVSDFVQTQRLRSIGISQQDALGIATQGLERSGGTLAGLSRLNPNAMSQLGAASRLGISSGTAATLMRGSEIGVQTSRPGQQLTDAIAAGFRIGLRGSDLTNYMESMAQNIERFRQTGMPVASARNFGHMSADIVGSGINPIRASVIAQNAQQSLAGIGEGGAQDATQIAMLRMAAGGRLENADDELRGRLNLENGNYVAEHFNDMREQFKQMVGGGAIGALRLHEFDKQYGGRSLTETAQPGIHAVSGAQFGDNDLMAAAQNGTSGQERTVAGTANQNLDSGAKMVDVVLQNEQRMADTLAKYTPQIESALQSITDFSSTLATEATNVKTGLDFLLDSLTLAANNINVLFGGQDAGAQIVKMATRRVGKAAAQQGVHP